jgi:uroporphyrinogen decarboxylase
MTNRLLAAFRGETTDSIPIWFMRQAGRSLPEYRALREHNDILKICRTPDLAVEVTMQPVRRLGVDAAILFSDIVIPLPSMGVSLEITPGVGPVIENPVRNEGDVDALRASSPQEELSFVLETIAILRKELDVPLIGFAGAPFTLASYLIEGGPSKNHARAKSMMYGAPETWHKLMDKLADTVLAFLRAQVGAGAQAVQLFDSWAGYLAPHDYREFAAPYVKRILDGLDGLEVPRITFGVMSGELLGVMAESGADVVGVDWRTPLDVARSRTNEEVVLQGNLDPVVCLAPWDVVAEHAADVLRRGGGRRHVFNLGHGVLPETDPDTLKRLVDFVHSRRADG